jgi:DNA modification methylase
MQLRNPPGSVRDSIVEFLATVEKASIQEIHEAVAARLGDVPASSIRSYLNLNVPDLFSRLDRGYYGLKFQEEKSYLNGSRFSGVVRGNSRLFHGDCFDWLRAQPSNSIHAVVTDPPYGLVEYTHKEQTKLRTNQGGVWRIPPAFDGYQRSPLPRFTVLTESDRVALHHFFVDFARLLVRVTVPGANIVVASNPLFAHIVTSALAAAGMEIRGTLIRLVMTMRGGDRPKNAHDEFPDVSVMPRSMSEPWIIARKPLEGRVQDNLRKWKTGGFRRISSDRPFGDVVKSHPTRTSERAVAPHPSLKPQAFLRHLVRAVLPLGEGIVLDPFAGSGSTLAAANAVGYKSVGVERDAAYVELAMRSIPLLEQVSICEIE